MGEWQSIGSLHNQNSQYQQHTASEAHICDNDCRKVTRQHIQFAHRLIESCLCKYMTKKEVIRELVRVNVKPCTANHVWQQLRDDNPVFFEYYYKKVHLREQIEEFNQLLMQQQYILRYEDDACDTKPLHNSLANLPVTSSIGNSAEQLYCPSIGATNMDPSFYESSDHMVDGVPTAGCSYTIQQNIDDQVIGTYSNGVLSPELEQILRQSAQSMAFNAAIPSNLGSAEDFQLDFHDGSRNSSENLSPHSNLTTGLTNPEDPTVIASFQGSPLLFADRIDIVADGPDECSIGDDLITDAPQHEAQSPVDVKNVYSWR